MVKNTGTEEKKDIRKQYLGIRKSISPDVRADADRRITERLLESSLFLEAQSVYCYVSYGHEADTRRILEESLRRGKKTAAPRVLGKRRMEFFFLETTEDLSPGFHSIPEPVTKCEMAPLPGSDALVIMPGTAFDRKGARLGYGGGYYDAYLSRCPECERAAIAYSVQITQLLPREPHDVRPHVIFTEKEMIVCPQEQDFREIR